METDIDSGLSRVFGQMNEPANIEDGKEIIIYSSTFQKTNIALNAYDAKTLQEHKLLNEYPYVHLVKVVLTK